MKIGELIKAVRSQHGLSQSAIASRLGVTKNYITKIETGRTAYPPSEQFLERFAAEFGQDREKLSLMCGRIPAEVQKKVAEKLLSDRA